jgi:hypothetical protein
LDAVAVLLDETANFKCLHAAEKIPRRRGFSRTSSGGDRRA